MNALGTVGLSAFAAGYAASHWLDPEVGRRRRARAAEQANRALRRAGEGAEKASHALANRARGVAASRDWTPLGRRLVAATGLATAVLALRRRSAFGAAAAVGALSAFARRREGATSRAGAAEAGVVPAAGGRPGEARLTLAPG